MNRNKQEFFNGVNKPDPNKPREKRPFGMYLIVAFAFALLATFVYFYFIK